MLTQSLNVLSKVEQDEYTNEGIYWQHIPFVDNQDILNMVGIQPLSIMALIDDETKFPKGKSFLYLKKIHLSAKAKFRF